jgi:hypothetical protein
MLAEVAGKEAADANVSEIARTQRQIIRDCLSGERRDKAEGCAPLHGISGGALRRHQEHSGGGSLGRNQPAVCDRLTRGDSAAAARRSRMRGKPSGPESLTIP